LNVAQQGLCVTAFSIIIALLSNVKRLPTRLHALRSVGWITLCSNVDAAFSSARRATRAWR
jgi:hypothetical protein